jgi:hypothetical protein
MQGRCSFWRGASSWGLLALVVLLAATRALDLGEALAEARASRNAIRSDADFYRAMAVLGPEHPIAGHLHASVALGTPIALEGPGRFTARRQRFWIALLPDYPIASDAELVICPAPCVGPDDTLLVQGQEFQLVRRSPRSAQP